MEGVALGWCWAVLTLERTSKLLFMGVTNSMLFAKNLAHAHLSHSSKYFLLGEWTTNHHHQLTKINGFQLHNMPWYTKV